MGNENALSKNDVNPSLWKKYTKDKEYIVDHSLHAIRRNHPIILHEENAGYIRVLRYFTKGLKRKDYTEKLLTRTTVEWVSEWKDLHKELFRKVFKSSEIGEFRNKAYYFGHPSYVDLYKIPKTYHEILDQINSFILLINEYCDFTKDKSKKNDDEAFFRIAEIHKEFIRIHPFKDGNGRIGRFLTDQLAVLYGFPPALGGYPRTDANAKKEYHECILDGLENPDKCAKLKNWIKKYIEEKIERLA